MQTTESLKQILRCWVDAKAANGIRQHSREWLDAKRTTIGGSSIGTLQGCNPYSSANQLVQERIGMCAFEPNIKMQWGNLFEDVIQRYVEHDKQCEVLGEFLYVEGSPGIAYSPDGLAVMFVPRPDGPAVPEIMLCEFKCPYSRVPTATPPKQYVAQVKMGMDVLELPTSGVLVEAVFRRCAIENLDTTSTYDLALHPRKVVGLPFAYGVIGFYLKDQAADGAAATTDLGTMCEESFTEIMSGYDNGTISVKYYEPSYVSKASHSALESFGREQMREGSTVTASRDVSGDIADFASFCADGGYTNLGVLPWKLIRVQYHLIQKEPDYMKPWMHDIAELLNVVHLYHAAETPAEKKMVYSMWATRGDEFA